MAKRNTGIFISFEGTEGSGKSTLIRTLKAQLEQLGFEVVSTREPGGSSVAEKIRSLILSEAMHPKTEIFLYEAARAEHWNLTVAPALQEGAIVLCDRFIDSSLAYQAYARGLPWNEIKTLNRMAIEGNKPHLTILLDIDPEKGLKRAQDPNRFEAEGVDFQRKVRAGYLKSRAEDPKRWFTLKVENKSPEELTETVVKYLKKRFKNRFQEVKK